MVKVGDTVKWDTKSQGMLGGKVIGGEKGKRWKIENKKTGKKYFVVKDKVKKGVVKKSEKKPAAKKPVVNKDVLQNVMGIMAEVAKDKGKSTKKEVDSKVALDKKAIAGKLTQKAFLEDVVLQDGYDGAHDQDWENRFESEMYNAPNNMTETQEQRFLDRASSRAYRDGEKFEKALFKKLIKGKKFKSFKEASKLFISNISKNHPDLDI